MNTHNLASRDFHLMIILSPTSLLIWKRVLAALFLASILLLSEADELNK